MKKLKDASEKNAVSKNKSSGLQAAQMEGCKFVFLLLS